MRAWRKTHSSVLESERLAQLSDGASCLFFMLIVAQDDSGYYPWEPAKVKRLIVSRPWSVSEATEFATEIVTVGMGEWIEGGLLLRRGEELNGQPRKDVTVELYPRSPDGPVALTPPQRHVPVTLPLRNEGVTLDKEQSRAEQKKSKEDTGASPSRPRSTLIDENFIEEMLVEYDDRLGGPDRVRAIIADAMNHKAMDKRKDKRQYLRTWLNRQIEFQANTNGRRTSRTDIELPPEGEAFRFFKDPQDAETD